jgi:Fe-S cluster biogenesis protein NfuA
VSGAVQTVAALLMNTSDTRIARPSLVTRAGVAPSLTAYRCGLRGGSRAVRSWMWFLSTVAVDGACGTCGVITIATHRLDGRIMMRI